MWGGREGKIKGRGPNTSMSLFLCLFSWAMAGKGGVPLILGGIELFWAPIAT